MFWARWRCFELGESWHHFFPGIFYIFLKFSLFVTDFFFASTGETFFVNPASGTMDITCPKDFPNRSLHTDLNSLYITALHFHFFSCWFEDFFYQKALWLNFLLLWMDPFCSLHNLCSFWRGYSLPVSLRDSTCILRGAEFFFTLGSLLPAFHRICIKKLLLFFWRRPLWNMAINGLMFLEKKTYQWRYVLWLCLIFYL